MFLSVAFCLLAERKKVVVALAGYGLSVLSAIWFAEGALARDTFTLLLIGLVAALPPRPGDSTLQTAADDELRPVRV